MNLQKRVFIHVTITDVDDSPIHQEGSAAAALFDIKPRTVNHVYDATLPRPDPDHACAWLATVLDPEYFKELDQ